MTPQEIGCRLRIPRGLHIAGYAAGRCSPYQVELGTDKLSHHRGPFAGHEPGL